MKEWEKDSWQDFEKRHLPNYEDENKLRQVLKTLESFPPQLTLEHHTHAPPTCIHPSYVGWNRPPPSVDQMKTQ